MLVAAMLFLGLTSVAAMPNQDRFELLPADFNKGSAHDFLQILRAAPAGTRGVVLDVGANDGTWTQSWAKLQQQFAAAHKPLDLHLFEPQPIFFDKLTAMARAQGATFLAAAAWKAEGHALWGATREGSTGAHRLPEGVLHGRITKKVRTTDLAAHILRHVPPGNGTVSLMKLDVEGELANSCPSRFTRAYMYTPIRYE
jgi:FkbM family methyltransferase